MIKIAVLAGGVSSERKVSLASGRNVAKAFLQSGHEVALLDPSSHISVSEELFVRAVEEIDAKIDLLLKKDPSQLVELDVKVLNALKSVDKVFSVLHGGSGENGKIHAVLELLGIAHNGSSPSALAVSMDKVLAKKLLSESGINTPAYTVCRKNKPLVLPPRYPCVVKPADGGSSLGVNFVFRPFELKRAVEQAFEYCDTVLLEAAVFGRELTVGVLEDKGLAITEIKPLAGFYDYDNKYVQGKTEEITPAPLPDEISSKALAVAEKAHAVLELKNFSRSDIIYEESSGLLYLLEVNAIPGMTNTSIFPQMAAYRNISFCELCLKMM